jgi:uncharacterized protein YrrD
MATRPEVVRQSDLINQLVLDRNTLEELGRVEVLWMYPPAHRVLGFICKTGFLGAKKIVFKLDQIEALGTNGVLTRAQPEETEAAKVNQLESLLQHEVWSDSGDKLGKITDCLFNLQTGEISQYLLVSSGWHGIADDIYQLSPAQIASVGRKRVLVAETTARSLTIFSEGLQQKLNKARDVLREDYLQIKQQALQELKAIAQQAQVKTEQAKGQFQTFTERAKERAQSFSQQAQERWQTLNEQIQTEAEQLAQRTQERRQTLAEQLKERTQALSKQMEEGIQTLTVHAEEILDRDEIFNQEEVLEQTDDRREDRTDGTEPPAQPPQAVDRTDLDLDLDDIWGDEEESEVPQAEQPRQASDRDIPKAKQSKPDPFSSDPFDVDEIGESERDRRSQTPSTSGSANLPDSSPIDEEDDEPWI